MFRSSDQQVSHLSGLRGLRLQQTAVAVSSQELTTYDSSSQAQVLKCVYVYRLLSIAPESSKAGSEEMAGVHDEDCTIRASAEIAVALVSEALSTTRYLTPRSHLISF